MATTVNQVIESARDLHELFDEDKVPGRLVLRFLQRYAKRLWGRIAQTDPNRFKKCQTFLIADYDFDAEPVVGFTLPAAIYYEGTKATVGGRDIEQPFAIVPPQEKVMPSVWPSAYIKNGNMLCLIGVERDWGFWTHISVDYVPVPPVLVDGASNFDPLPDDVEDVLIAQAAYFMARRLQKEIGAPSLVDFRNESVEAQETFITTIANQKTGTVQTIRPIW